MKLIITAAVLLLLVGCERQPRVPADLPTQSPVCNAAAQLLVGCERQPRVPEVMVTEDNTAMQVVRVHGRYKTVEVHMVTVDGAQCAVLIGNRGNSIACDWPEEKY